MLKSHDQLRKAVNKIIDENGKWVTGVPAIVADNNDPENQHRVRVIIPCIDENMIFDEWIRQFVFCLGDGFGTVFIPAVGSEVVLFGEFGQKYNLYYASVYNDEMAISSQLGKDTAGIHAPVDLKLIAEEVAKILAKDVEIIAEQSAKLKGENATVEAGLKAEMKGEQIEINGVTLAINGDGTVSIHGASVAITGAAVTILGRTVLNNGQPI